jgi:hypothetical protein
MKRNILFALNMMLVCNHLGEKIISTLECAQWIVHVMKNKRGGNFWSFEPWPKRCGMVDGQEQRVMVTATWRADHVRHEMITCRVVNDDHVRGDWWPIRQGNARKNWHHNATLFGPCPNRMLLLCIYKEAGTASSYIVSAHLSCSNAVVHERRPWLQKGVSRASLFQSDFNRYGNELVILIFLKTNTNNFCKNNSTVSIKYSDKIAGGGDRNRPHHMHRWYEQKNFVSGSIIDYDICMHIL